MRILLVQPNDVAGNYIPKRPMMGLGYVAAGLIQCDHLVEIVDMRIYNINYFKNVLKRFKPQFVGFTLTALTIKQTEILMKITKELTNAKIVVGGPEVSLVPHKILEYNDVDFIIMHEGDRSFPALINSYNNNSYKDIPGLGYKEKGKIKINKPKEIQDLNSLWLPAWHLFPLKKYNKNISKIKFPILSSRGCPFTCMFCDSTKINGKYRVRSPKNVVDEIEWLKNTYGTKSFQFLDDNFALYQDRVIRICDEIIKRNIKIKWVVGQGFVASKARLDVFKKMKEAGCEVIYFGIESADDEVLRFIRKPATVAQIVEAIKLAKQAGLIVKAPFISGLPKSTYAKEKKYIEFFKENDIDMPRMATAVPFPNTDLYDWVKKNAKPIGDLETCHIRMSHTRGALGTDLFQPAYETEDFTKEERIKIMNEFQEESEKWMLQRLLDKHIGKTLSKPLSILMYLLSRNKTIRRLGIKMLDISNKY